MLIDEHICPDGRVAQTFIAAIAFPEGDGEGAGRGGGRVRVFSDDGLDGVLPVRALESVMLRYGHPLDEDVIVDGPSVELGEGRVLQALRYRAMVDASSRDYLVWRAPGVEPVAALGRNVSAALRYLVERMAARRAD